ncbi:hypothetical protein [Vibrio cholerae]|uniref:hypothetical protein n=1 Tax=Vibrio cholerae TaxID=666 RepID=UPI0011DB397A|nr:hypothetical protein [Vibrio cholerae]TXY22913.1 hypothetical protein FXE90_09820 [Vibrio cholerae]GHX75536.1 hypothetical protein VCSRO110_0697 [Vibrio cholerae]GIA98591.1 hypothetical protein VCSRO184_0262 [Vibrio cholerae]HDI3344692.1 hypothetical protein [Vibrio cholerae]HDL9517400.1 hypothetical protein [Vibrio cholerae]
MPLSEFPKVFLVQNDRLIVSEELHESLNLLAARFYALHGYTPPISFDYSKSQHPQELLMYRMALEAAYMQQQTGELDM